MTSITIPLPKQEKERLSRIALRYGFSLADFSRRILEEVVDAIPEESLSEYAHPRRLSASLRSAMQNWRAGNVSTRL